MAVPTATYDPQKTATTASLPSEVTNVRHWRTREDPFSTVWEQVQRRIKPRGRSYGHMFERPIIRAVGTYFSLSELAMIRHSGVLP